MTKRTADIFEGSDKEHAEFIRATCKSLGSELPSHWTNEQVVGFFNTVSDDQPRVWTDCEKADMKYASQIMGG